MDDAEARLRESALAGDGLAMRNLAGFHEVRGRRDEAELWYRRSAKTGNRFAMAALAHSFASRGLAAEAEIWYRRAAETGDKYAITDLARFLTARGRDDEAKTWYRQAADAGDGLAKKALAGFPVHRGWDGEAETWYRQAADKGDRHAMTTLARAFADQGQDAEAESWFRLAESKGDRYAVMYLAHFLTEQGRDDDAETWYRRAAALGDRFEAVYVADLLYRRGKTAEAVDMHLHSTTKLVPPYERHLYVNVPDDWVDDLRAQGKVEEANALVAEIERQRQPPLVLDSAVTAAMGTGIESVAATVVITAAAVPFLQTIMTKAGEDGYRTARSALQRLIGRKQDPDPLPPAPDADMSSVILHVPMDVPDEALQRLTSMDLAALRRASEARVIEVFWDNAGQQWNVVTRG
ncbi:tetratricopeptide repeat protein [Streptomyces sp. NPDC058321]|uniref:tetratricopeptide repeat protein n=1 Tax=Streptomyces sp. NPDC058321 TaxID=3346445 RepID=UPI0036F08C4F